MRSSLLTWLAACSILLAASFSAAGNGNYPLRQEFPDVAVINLVQLQQKLAHLTVIDVRSRFEYETVRITGAKWAPVSIRQFDIDLGKITGNDHNLELVFYCNGQSCNKSYLAARHAKMNGYKKVWAFDAGVLAWAQQYPQHTTLLETTPANPARLISREQYQQHLLPSTQFKKLCIGPNRVVFDIRDPVQREDKRYLDGIAQRYPLDRLIKLLDTPEFRKKHSNKTFCFFDAAGRQVPWLQYYLDSHNYRNYHFLKDGVLGPVNTNSDASVASQFAPI